MSYEATGMPDDDTREPSSRRRAIERIDSISVVSGLVFIAIALAALTDRYWADIDAALVFGGAIVAIGVALMVSVVLRHRRREQHDGSLPG
ncbi:MAG: hypothetical protein F4Y05_07330 [Acidimicrobiaceae bacterium]|nr:hypothetical protein [Acidimicrobiaceae bacterium]MYE09400.1 hypothetical protein [Acidimicrobiaceae bacterium]MYI36601.1 hypothetical protein [Acidimicrobiaceae bacterium]